VDSQLARRLRPARRPAWLASGAIPRLDRGHQRSCAAYAGI